MSADRLEGHTLQTELPIPTRDDLNQLRHPERKGCLPIFAIVTLALTCPFKLSKIDGYSMRPNYESKTWLALGPVLVGDFEQFSLIEFNNPHNGNQPYFKRIVAVAGDTVSSSDGKLVVNGNEVVEPFLTIGSVDFATCVVPHDHVFVLGDNRANSNDSRDFGPVSLTESEARLVVFSLPKLFSSED